MILPQGPWTVIMADPAWSFSSNSKAKPGRNARGHYDCMTLDEIKAMPVAEVAARDSMLYLWATSPMTPHALEVMTAWGFTYKSQIVWDKMKRGTGFHVRNEHELILIGRRGKGPLMAHRTRTGSIIREKARQHSRKPEAAYTMLEEGYPDTPKLELFARCQRPNWTAWGDQVERFAA